MGPKYVKGTRVRIKAHDFMGAILDPRIQQYENVMGEIMDSVNVVAFLSDPRAITGSTGTRITIYHYTIKINDQLTLPDIPEDCLEIMR